MLDHIEVTAAAMKRKLAQEARASQQLGEVFLWMKEWPMHPAQSPLDASGGGADADMAMEATHQRRLGQIRALQALAPLPVPPLFPVCPERNMAGATRGGACPTVEATASYARGGGSRDSHPAGADRR